MVELTMERMAEELGVSRATLSAVINGREKRQRVSDATAAKVRDYLARRGYVRPKSAVQLRKGAPEGLTGIMYCGDFLRFGHLLRALSVLGDHVREKHGLVEITGVDPANSLDALREQISKGVRNLIWIHANDPAVEMRNAETLFPLLERLERTIIFNYDFRQPEWEGEFLRRGIHLLGYDRPDAYRRAAELFARRGRHRMGFPEFALGSNAPLPGSFPIAELFRQHGIETLGVHSGDGQYNAELLAKHMAELSRTDGLDCAFVRHDLLCAEVIAHLQRHGINVPDDIAVLGFGDLPLLGLLPVPVSTFALPVDALCQEAAALLDAEEPPPAKRIQLEIPLILRSSHGKD